MRHASSLEASDVELAVLGALFRSQAETRPYRHWLLDQVLPEDVCRAIDALPIAAPEVGDTQGRRETNNSTRRFFAADEQARYGACREVAAAFQGRAVTTAIETLCGIDLDHTYLRIEYCQDREGFWLEPHTDIGAKLFTLLIYLSDDPGAEAWGTDIYDGPETWVGASPYGRGLGLMFVPDRDTWHGFRQRPLGGLRRSLIVNYVRDEWRARHELAFPEMPVRGLSP